MKRWSAALALMVCLSSSLFAQFDSASVLGVVRDGTGAVVPATLVSLTNLDTGIQAEATTTSLGEFEFASVKVGRYKLEAQKQGFPTAVANDLVLNVSARRRVDLTLTPAQSSESIEVTATAVSLETDSSQRGQLISKAQAVELPLNGREYSQLVLLTSGVRQSAVGCSEFRLSNSGLGRGTISVHPNRVPGRRSRPVARAIPTLGSTITALPKF